MNAMSKLSKAFWKDMLHHFNANLVQKENSEAMKAISHVLDTIGVLDGDAFLTRFSTTLGSEIYTPFIPGEGSELDCWQQIGTCAHECLHVVQARRDGLAVFSGKYLFDKTARATYEAEAYRVNMHLAFWRFGEIRRHYSPEYLSSLLKSYALEQSHIDYAKSYLEMSRRAIEQGAILDDVSQYAIDWLNTHASHIKV